MVSRQILLVVLLILSQHASSGTSMKYASDDQFLLKYLDDWISLMNRTMAGLKPIEEVTEGDPPPPLGPNEITARCHEHMWYLLIGARARNPWALKSKQDNFWLFWFSFVLDTQYNPEFWEFSNSLHFSLPLLSWFKSWFLTFHYSFPLFFF